MKNILSKSWGFLRIVNALLGLFFLSQFVLYLDWFALVFASILLIQSYLNVVCLMGACRTPGAFSQNKNASTKDDIIYEEIGHVSKPGQLTNQNKNCGSKTVTPKS